MASKVSAVGEGKMIKVRYLGEAEEPTLFVGAATRKEYKVGGRVNLVEVDVRDLATGHSWSPGLFEMKGPKGEDLFTIHVPRKKKQKPMSADRQAKLEDSGGEDPLPGD